MNRGILFSLKHPRCSQRRTPYLKRLLLYYRRYGSYNSKTKNLFKFVILDAINFMIGIALTGILTLGLINVWHYSFVCLPGFIVLKLENKIVKCVIFTALLQKCLQMDKLFVFHLNFDRFMKRVIWILYSFLIWKAYVPGSRRAKLFFLNMI